MTVTRMPRRMVFVVVISAVVLVTYGHTFSYGLVWDDYLALRPRSLSVVLSAWTGEWDANGVWPVFYRPLALTAYASVYALFGHDTFALHALNLLGLFAAAALAASFVRRESGSDGAGMLAALLLIIHPETSSALAAWISQQFHLLALIAVISALLVWQRVRSGSARGWLPVLLPLTAGVLVKEDVVMLAPALLLMQAIRARVVGDVPAFSRGVAGVLLTWAAAFVLLRTMMIGEIGGYGMPTPEETVLNFVRGPVFAFGVQWVPSVRVLAGIAGACAMVVVVLAGAEYRRRPAVPRMAALALYGLALGACVNLPLVLISGHTRIHLMIFAAVLLWTGAAGICRASLPDDKRRLAAAALVAWMLLMAVASWRHATTFAPCAKETLETDRDVLEWEIVSPEIRRGLVEKATQCAAGIR